LTPKFKNEIKKQGLTLFPDNARAITGALNPIFTKVMIEIHHNPEDMGVLLISRNIHDNGHFSFKCGGDGARGAGVTIVQHGGKPPSFDTLIIRVETGKRNT